MVLICTLLSCVIMFLILLLFFSVFVFFFFKQKTAYEMRISDWSSDVCSSDLHPRHLPRAARGLGARNGRLACDECSFPWGGADGRHRDRGLGCQRHRCARPGPLSRGRRCAGAGYMEIGRASCRERVGKFGSLSVGAVP